MLHVEIPPRVETYFSEQNKICPLGIFSYMGYFLMGFCPLGFCSHGIFSSWIFSSWDIFLHGILSSWDFIRIPTTRYWYLHLAGECSLWVTVDSTCSYGRCSSLFIQQFGWVFAVVKSEKVQVFINYLGTTMHYYFLNKGKDTTRADSSDALNKCKNI